MGRLVCLVNTTTDRHPSTLIAYYEITGWDGDPYPADPDISDVAVVSRAEALRLILQEPLAQRRVVEPVAAYLRGDTAAPTVWTWHGDQVYAAYKEGETA